MALSLKVNCDAKIKQKFPVFLNVSKFQRVRLNHAIDFYDRQIFCREFKLSETEIRFTTN